MRNLLHCTKTSHLIYSVFTLVSISLISSSAVFAQAKDTKGPPKPQEMTLTAQGGWPIAITYFESSNASESPVVVLLHGKGGSKRVWDQQFAPILQQNGYAVVSVDLRKHGKSQLTAADAGGNQNQKGSSRDKLSALDYRAMVGLDMEAVWKFLYEEHQKKHLNMQKTAVIASDMSVPIVLNYALYDWSKIPYDDAPVLAAKTPKGQTVRALVLISPDASVPGVSASRAAVKVKEPILGVSFFVCTGASDSLDRGSANKLYTLLSSAQDSKERMYFKEYPGKLRGTDMIGKRLGLELDILKFLDKHLKKLPGDWSDRRPRYDRDE
ncbi:alpha/beta hydrolase [Gimesia algae]|uniref:Alpha/beta hydrolase family protein n=1 Tax=Gimesia algae TaxID=2527971 RepID=A0A517VGG0_9PLAN|nr:alpha/beta hydrolase [Gimesia algae]QDT92027.1 Alpha/beta hydrolase family protein [Gimesia algae]